MAGQAEFSKFTNVAGEKEKRYGNHAESHDRTFS